jgi:NTE family protein
MEEPSMVRDLDVTLVCGGGGVWGIAWMTGVIAGLADAGLDLRCFTKFIGTSAGSVVAAQLLGGVPLTDLFERQTVESKQPRELTPLADALDALGTLMKRQWADDRERLKAVCDLALSATTVSTAERRQSIAKRLAPQRDAWPNMPLLITAVDVDDLSLRVFDADAGVSLTDAVSASCAVPGVWPAVEIDRRRYVDGGIWRTAENAHLATGSRFVLVLSPMGTFSIDGKETKLAREIAQLEKQGATVLVIFADEASLSTIGAGPLDPSSRSAAAVSGRKQGARAAARLKDVLPSSTVRAI